MPKKEKKKAENQPKKSSLQFSRYLLENHREKNQIRDLVRILKSQILAVQKGKRSRVDPKIPGKIIDLAKQYRVYPPIRYRGLASRINQITPIGGKKFPPFSTFQEK